MVNSDRVGTTSRRPSLLSRITMDKLPVEEIAPVVEKSCKDAMPLGTSSGRSVAIPAQRPVPGSSSVVKQPPMSVSVPPAPSEPAMLPPARPGTLSVHSPFSGTISEVPPAQGQIVSVAVDVEHRSASADAGHDGATAAEDQALEVVDLTEPKAKTQGSQDRHDSEEGRNNNNNNGAEEPATADTSTTSSLNAEAADPSLKIQSAPAAASETLANEDSQPADLPASSAKCTTAESSVPVPSSPVPSELSYVDDLDEQAKSSSQDVEPAQVIRPVEVQAEDALRSADEVMPQVTSEARATTGTLGAAPQENYVVSSTFPAQPAPQVPADRPDPPVASGSGQAAAPPVPPAPGGAGTDGKCIVCTYISTWTD